LRWSGGATARMYDREVVQSTVEAMKRIKETMVSQEL